MTNLDYIQTLINKGRWSFSSSEMSEYLGFSSKDKLSILRKNGRIISPIRGFYVIVPEEYLNTDRLPVERYIDAMMCYSGHPYYVGLLTASSFYGASHQSPQAFQVITHIDKRNIAIARNHILFYRKRNMSDIPTINRKTTTGYFNISTPETTLFDLVEFQKQVGGLEQVGLIAMELSEKLSGNSLVETAEYHPNPFNPLTTIQYDLPEKSYVQIIIYDILGNEINTLVNGLEQPGFRQITWNGTDQNSISVSSGVYLIRFSAESIQSNATYKRNSKLMFIK